MAMVARGKGKRYMQLPPQPPPPPPPAGKSTTLTKTGDRGKLYKVLTIILTLIL